MIKKISLLPLNLQFFAADNGSEGANGADTPAEAQNTAEKAPEEQKQQEHMIPKSRFDEINEKYKGLQAQLDSMQDEKQQAEVKAKEEDGEFKTLYETTSQEFAEFKKQFESVETQKQELEGVISELLTSKLKSVPAEYHELIPENLTVSQKLAWVDKAEQKGMFSTRKVEEPIGGATNPSINTKVDANKLNGIQKLTMGYGLWKK